MVSVGAVGLMRYAPLRGGNIVATVYVNYAMLRRYIGACDTADNYKY